MEILKCSSAFGPSNPVACASSKERSVVSFEADDIRERGDVVHAVDPVSDDEPLCQPGFFQQSFKGVDVPVRVPGDLGPAEYARVDDRCVVEPVRENRCIPSSEGGYAAEVSVVP